MNADAEAILKLLRDAEVEWAHGDHPHAFKSQHDEYLASRIAGAFRQVGFVAPDASGFSVGRTGVVADDWSPVFVFEPGE
jgi:hypothetical protein